MDLELAEPTASDEAFHIDIDGYEGPLDLLLELARRQKVDLIHISILALTEQYLQFIEATRKIRLELAADYLVMAAWLAYLKSRLLLPEPPKGDEPQAAELAEALAHRLRRLEAMRRAAERLVNRPRMGRDFFARGAPEEMNAQTKPLYSASLYDLLAAYASQRQKQALSRVVLKQRFVWSLAQAREALERMIGQSTDWLQLEPFLKDFGLGVEGQRTLLASSFSAALELVKEGKCVVRQDTAFAPLWMRPNVRAKAS